MKRKVRPTLEIRTSKCGRYCKLGCQYNNKGNDCTLFMEPLTLTIYSNLTCDFNRRPSCKELDRETHV